MSLPADLQRAISETGARVQRGFPWWLRPLLLRGVAGITLGRRIYLREADDIVPLLRHELVHVRQIARYGAFAFYGRWLREYAVNRWRGMSSDEAYRRISFEAEAFAEENV